MPQGIGTVSSTKAYARPPLAPQGIRLASASTAPSRTGRERLSVTAEPSPESMRELRTPTPFAIHPVPAQIHVRTAPEMERSLHLPLWPQLPEPCVAKSNHRRRGSSHLRLSVALPISARRSKTQTGRAHLDEPRWRQSPLSPPSCQETEREQFCQDRPTQRFAEHPSLAATILLESKLRRQGMN